jgi:hypothetical protein
MHNTVENQGSNKKIKKVLINFNQNQQQPVPNFNPRFNNILV